LCLEVVCLCGYVTWCVDTLCLFRNVLQCSVLLSLGWSCQCYLDGMIGDVVVMLYCMLCYFKSATENKQFPLSRRNLWAVAVTYKDLPESFNNDFCNPW
jgi:hypothetical protein